MNTPESRNTLRRVGYFLCLGLGLLTIWLSPQPPMIDLPQHAGQLRLLRDLLLGTSPWADLLEINLWTPYFIAFGLALPLSLVLPMAVALQLVMSGAYIAFVFFCIKLRRAFGAPAALDWLFLFSFFGFAFRWGFLTFQVAAPLGLTFILACLRHARVPTLQRGLGLGVLGVVVMLSHGLVFLYVVGVGLVLMAQHARSLRAGLARAWPLLLLLLLCAVYSVLRAQADARYAIPPTVPAVNWHAGLRHEHLFYSFGTGWNGVFALVATVALAAPWLAGYRIPLQPRRIALAPLAVLLPVLLFVPSFAMEISLLYQRFALFLFPAYAWAFAAAPQRAVRRWPVGALALASVLVLLANAGWSWRFGRESADFRAVVARIAPGQRALALVLESTTEVGPTPDFTPYVHFASWYQAEQGGLVDLNFAVAPPQIVRFRPDRVPPLPLAFAWRPMEFDWKRHDADRYRYFFVRRGPAQAAPDFAGARCMPRLIVEEGRWSVYERVAGCAATP
ncbi:hypothetical protein [Pseudorhodoferax sp. Leaf267]|uniref:hypothetical protein n=1 Tax=Pseudorhodoferax sp. Leaf267 TaxID=1736316 RepID=UPI0006FC3E63|nr:hypothetical protein [Pseudorhodoferax sp. Leaf267]KQP11881.1 hypothetical protein ASF43_23295 [Pseudorhodoferax sp. Leaf267]